MIRGHSERTVSIPVKIRKTGVELFYGGPLPDLVEGTIGDLVVPAFAFQDDEVLQQFIRELAGPILPAGTLLLATVNAAPMPEKGVLPEPPFGRAPLEAASFVEIVLQEALELTLRGTKRAALRACSCRIPALKVSARSVNHAYTLVSQRFESKRISHTGNVFTKVYYPDGADHAKAVWRPLESLRGPREAAIEQRVRGFATKKTGSE